MKHTIISASRNLLRAIPLALFGMVSLGQTIPAHAATDTARVVKYRAERHRSDKSQTALLNAHHPARKRRDSRLHDRRQRILDHQRRA